MKTQNFTRASWWLNPLFFFALLILPYDQTTGATLMVTSTNDSGVGTLREAIQKAHAGDSINFDPVAFPPNAPVTIFLSNSLPALSQGGLTIDGSGAGVVLDGSQIGAIPYSVLLDDISLSVDGGPNLIVNGDFSSGLGHWRPWQERTGATRTLMETDYHDASPCLEWSVIAQSGECHTLYDTEDRTDPQNNIYPFFSGQSLWIPLNKAGTAELRFWYKQGPLTVSLIDLLSSGSSQWIGSWSFSRSTSWKEALVRANAPSGVQGITLELSFSHPAVTNSCLSILSNSNKILGLQIINFPHNGIELGNGAQNNTIGGSRGVGVGPIGQGNLISGHGANGISVTRSHRNKIIGNYIGTDLSGQNGKGNFQFGISIESGTNNNVGGESNNDWNVISGNGWSGIALGGPDTTGNSIRGNLIGTDSSGLHSVPNMDGISLGSGAERNQIGGSAPKERNILSGNKARGIFFDGAHGNTIIGNYIGTDVTGCSKLGNLQGMHLFGGSDSNQVGGVELGEGNIVSGNDDFGIGVSGAKGNRILGNLIGVDVSGSIRMPNASNGLQFWEDWSGAGVGNVIGPGNVISANSMNGILISNSSSVSNWICGNIIGLGIRMDVPLGNNGAGICIQAGSHHNLIGGDGPDNANVVSANRGDGIVVNGVTTRVNTISRNSIFNNSGLGVNLENGANNSIAPPSNVVANTNSISGITSPGATVEVFSDERDEGRVFEGSVVADAVGHFTFNKPEGFAGPRITATATDTNGNTSEFSASRKIGEAFYQEDFEAGAGPEWSNRKTEVTPVGNRRFLGQLGSQTVSLTLSNLPPHSRLTISFDLFIIRTWDGLETTSGGPDIFDLSIAGGPRLIRTTFNTHDYFTSRFQSYPDSYPGGKHPIFTGASEVNTLGYKWDWRSYPEYAGWGIVNMDCVYRLAFNVAHSADSVKLSFAALGLEPLNNESWGLDNVVVSLADLPTNAPPEIVAQPQDQAVVRSGEAVFRVVVASEAPVSFQWKHDGNRLVGETNALLVVPTFDASQTGDYWVEVSNDFGSVTSTVARLTVASGVMRAITSTNDNGPGTLREALYNVRRGDTINFDPASFPPSVPATIFVTNSLLLSLGGVTIDASDAGVILDGRQFGATPEATLIDDVSLTFDDGTNVVMNGDFSAGMGHWSTFDEAEGHVRGLNSTNRVSAPQSYQILSTARALEARTFYDTRDRSKAFTNWPTADPNSTVWITVIAGQRASLRFSVRVVAPSNTPLVSAYLILKHIGDWTSTLGEWHASGSSSAWRQGEVNVTLPGDAVAIAVQFENVHRQRWYSGFWVNSSGNTIRGLQVVRFPGVGIALADGGHHNVIGGDRAVGSGILGQGNLVSGNGGYGICLYGPASDNAILGNYIGIAMDGETAFPNEFKGLAIFNGANNRIGGSHPGERNIISGNGVRAQGALGIHLGSPDVRNTIIAGNIIGLDASGMKAVPNRGNGILIYDGSAGNTVGGNDPEQRNVISGNEGNGIGLYTMGTSNNVVAGNYIGTEATGLVAIPNDANGIDVNGVSEIIIGGEEPNQRNVIAGNHKWGIYLSGASNNIVKGNYIGINASGQTALPNGSDGIRLDGGAGYNVIGGSKPGEGNIISGNLWKGVFMQDAHDNFLLGNYIGTDASGMIAIGNAMAGATIYDNCQRNRVGGGNPGEGNLISGNVLNGVELSGSGSNNWVVGNRIGANVAGTSPLGNGGNGVEINGSSHNLIGGSNSGNVIAFNGGDGVHVGYNTNVSVNTISQNTIFSNGGLGINLDGGANNNIRPPTISSASINWLAGTTGPGWTVEVFSDASDEGRYFEGTVFADTNGNFSFRKEVPFLGPHVTATATDPSGNTSEFGIGTPPTIVTQPRSTNVIVGLNASISAPATGTEPLSYQWFRNGSLLPEPQQNALRFNQVQPSDAGRYVVIVTNAYGSVTSAPAVLTITGNPPLFSQQPQSQNLKVGDTLDLSVPATGWEPINYQWFFNYGPIAGANQFELMISSVQLTNSGRYFLQASNYFGVGASATATVTVFSPLKVTTIKTTNLIQIGQSMTLRIAVEGEGPFQYQWQVNGEAISGATNDTYAITNIQPKDGGSYRVLVANAAEVAAADVAEVIVTVPPAPAGDYFTNRIVLSAGQGVLRTTNDWASIEPGEPRHAGKEGGHSIWFKWIAPTQGNVRLSTAGSSFDTLLGVYTGITLTNLTSIASDEDRGGYLTSQTTFAVEAGVEYQIAVDGFAGEMGTVVLEWAFEATPDVLPQITVQPQSQMVASGSGATLEVQATGPGLHYQWYQNGALIAGAKNITLVLTNVGLAQVGGYSVQVINANGTQTNESQVAFIEVYQVIEGQVANPALGQDKLQDLTGGGAVKAMGAKAADMAKVRIAPMARWQVVRPMDLPLVSGYTISRWGDTSFDTTQVFENQGDSVITGHSRWQALVVPYAGICTLSTEGSGFDTVLEVIQMKELEPVRVAYDDNSGADGRSSWLQFEADPAEEYYVRVAGVGEAKGKYQLTEMLEVPQRYRQWEHIAGEGYVFTLQVPKAMVFRVDGSTDLKNWEGILSTNSVAGLYEFRHSDNQRYDHRFYRAVLFP